MKPLNTFAPRITNWRRPLSRREFSVLPWIGGALPMAPIQAEQPPESSRPYWEQISRFWDPFDLVIIRALGLTRRDRVLDAGCGYGGHLLLFARFAGAVAGFDREPDRVEIAKGRLAAATLAPKVEVRVADLMAQPYPNGSFTLVWCSHVLHAIDDMPRAMQILVRMTRPGGRVVIRENRVGSMSWLPVDLGVGEPGLEARLEYALLRWLAGDRRRRGPYPYGWTHLLREAGLVDVQARSFLHEREGPFDELERAYLAARLRRRAALEGVSEADRQLVARLLDPEDPVYVFRRNDLYFTAVSTIYVGRRAG